MPKETVVDKGNKAQRLTLIEWIKYESKNDLITFVKILDFIKLFSNA